MLALQNVPAAGAALPGFRLSPLSVRREMAKFNLTLEMAEGGHGMAGTIEYNRDLFNRSTVLRLLAHFERLLEGMAAVPEMAVGELPLLSEREQAQLLEWNDTARTAREVPPDATLHGLFAEQARRSPSALAVVFGREVMTYGELDDRANRVARHLGELGVGPEARVGIAMERSLELVVALLATLKAGAAYVPLDLSYPAERLAAMAEDAFGGLERPVLLVQSAPAALPAALRAQGVQVVSIDDIPEPAGGSRDDDPAGAASPDGLAYVIFTSGTTGRPKGAMNTHRAIGNRLLWMQDSYNLGAGDRILQKTPFSFDVSVWEFFWPLLTGARLVLALPGGHHDPSYLARLIAEEGVTTVHFVPSMLRLFLEEPAVASLASLRRVIASGEALPADLAARFHARMPEKTELHNLYGPTEAAVDVTSWPCGHGDARTSIPIGRPVANTRIHLLDRGCLPVPAGVAGEALYRRRPGRTRVPQPPGADCGAVRPRSLAGHVAGKPPLSDGRPGSPAVRRHPGIPGADRPSGQGPRPPDRAGGGRGGPAAASRPSGGRGRGAHPGW